MQSGTTISDCFYTLKSLILERDLIDLQEESETNKPNATSSGEKSGSDESSSRVLGTNPENPPVSTPVSPRPEAPKSNPQPYRRKPDRRFYRRNGNQRRYSQQRNQPYQNLYIANKLISIVVPLFNEAESVVELSITIKKVMGSIRANYEVIFIDDGSTDNSFLKIKEIHHLNNRFKCIRFKRNYGKSAALSEGFNAAKGDIVITMDSDLQDDPEGIPTLIQRLNEGYDLVSGWKKVRHDPFIKRQSSKLFNFVTSKLVGLRLHDFNCGFKAYRKHVIKNVKIYGELHRYIPALAYLSGYKVAEVPVKHHPRKFGKTKFGSSRFIKGMFDLLTVLFTTKYIRRPLHFFGFAGLLSMIAGFGIIAYLTVLKFFDAVPISNRPLFFVGILLAIVGTQFISLGLIAEMITKTSAERENIIIEQTLS
jgi:glycosyltransferase involved in cell wall biosynthesis